MTDIDRLIDSQEATTRTADAIEKMLLDVLWSKADGDVERALAVMGGENETLRNLFAAMRRRGRE